MNDLNELLDISEAAQFLNVSETSLRRWTNSGALACLRVGRRRERRFRRVDLLAFMEQSGPANLRASRDDQVTVKQGDHLCGIYGSDAGRIALTVPFLLDGLREGSACVLIATPRGKKQILKNLGDINPGLSSDIKSGRITLGGYGKSPKAQWDLIIECLEKARSTGASSLRLVGDVTGLRSTLSPKELVAFEMGLDEEVVARFPVAILCLYDAREFTGIELLNALKTHPDTLRYPLNRALA